MDSDSSEDENVDRIREAADNDFFSNSLYNSATSSSGKEEVPTHKGRSIGKPSVRTLLLNEEKSNDLNVTPEFQNFVARRLTQIIESKVKEVESLPSVQEKKAVSGGILLFGGSSQYVVCDDKMQPSSEHNHKRMRRHLQKTDHKEMDERCREAAVSANWVLSQQAIAGWERSKKGKVEILKREDVIFTQGCDTELKAKKSSHSVVEQHLVPDVGKKKKRLKSLHKESLKQEKQYKTMQVSSEEGVDYNSRSNKKKRKQE